MDAVEFILIFLSFTLDHQNNRRILKIFYLINNYTTKIVYLIFIIIITISSARSFYCSHNENHVFFIKEGRKPPNTLLLLPSLLR